jgi:hypothetical protein
MSVLECEPTFTIPQLDVPAHLITRNIHPNKHFPFLFAIMESVILGGRQAKDTHYAWLKVSYESGYNYEPTFGQVLFLFGPKQNGKTLLCNRVYVPLLGNKQANPYDYMVGKTTFSDDIFKAPVLAINDEEAPVDFKSKSAMLQKLKGFAANGKHTYHPKHLKKATVDWHGRMVITGNDDPNSLKMLVEINSNTEDKIIMLFTGPYCGEWPRKPVTEARIAHELPYFARWLLEWTPPANVMDSTNRCQVKSYHHPKLLQAATQQERSFTLVELIRLWVAKGIYWQSPSAPHNAPEVWEGDPTALFSQLCADNDRSMELLLRDWTVEKVAGALGTLARQGGLGVESIHADGKRLFRINSVEIG